MTKINFIKNKNLERERLGEQSLSIGLCLDYGHKCPTLEGNVVDKQQTELEVDTKYLLNSEDKTTLWKWYLG